jgi:hypothetical protein
MLSQLRDDLAEIIEGLEGKSLAYDVAVEGAKAQVSGGLDFCLMLHSSGGHDEPEILRSSSR